MVSTATILACVFTLCICLFLPVVLLILFVRKYKQERIFPAWLLGAAGFFVTQMLIRVPILTVLQTRDWFMAFSRNAPFLYAFSLAFTAGLFELAGRFVVAKLMVKNLTFRRSLAAGLGHGGIEAIVLIGLTYVNNLIYIVMINTGAFDILVAEASAAASSAPLDIDTILAQLELIKTQLIGYPSGLFLLASVERVLTICCHAGMSLIVCYGVATKKALPCLLICLGIHTLLDLTAGISLLIGSTLSMTAAYLIIYLILTLAAAVSLLIIRKLRSIWPKKEVTL